MYKGLSVYMGEEGGLNGRGIAYGGKGTYSLNNITGFNKKFGPALFCFPSKNDGLVSFSEISKPTS